MYSTNFRHQLYLQSAKALLILCLSTWGLTDSLLAQKRTWNLRDYELKPLHYGFQIGLQTTNFRVRTSEFFNANGDSTIAIASKNTPGAFIGFIVDLPIDEEFFNIRINPGVSFYEHKVRYEYLGTEAVEENVESAFFELPILLKYKSLRRANTRMYMIGGLSLGIKVGNNKQKLDPTRLATDDTNVELTYGAGFDLYLPYFKFSPEVRISHGLNNLRYRNNNSFTNNVERISMHRVTLFLNFE